VAAADSDGDRLTFGIEGGRGRRRLITRRSALGTLQVNPATGDYVYRPTSRAMNAAGPNTFDEFVTTVTDGKVLTRSTFRVRIVPAAERAAEAEFLIGSLAPEAPDNVITPLPVRGDDVAPPVVASRQQYVEFTLHGVSAEVRRSHLRFYANNRLISLRRTKLVKVAEADGRTTYRLLGMPHISSARATFTFVVGGPGGGATTTWRRR
jgi:hypothetical protein